MADEEKPASFISDNVKLFNPQTQDFVFVPSEKVSDAVANGGLSFPDTNPIAVIDKATNEPRRVSAEKAQQAFASGKYDFMPPSEQHKLNLKISAEKDPFGAVKTAVAGGIDAAMFGQFLTFAKSARSARQVGLEEWLPAYYEAYPGSKTFGKIAGITASSFVPIAPFGAVGVGAELVGESVAHLLGRSAIQKLAEAGGEVAVKSLGQKALKLGVAGAIEGAAMEVSDLASEESLGHAEFNAGTIMHSALHGAAFGAAGGVALGAFGHVAGKTFDKIAEFAKPIPLSEADLTSVEAIKKSNMLTRAWAKIASIGKKDIEPEDLLLASQNLDRAARGANKSYQQAVAKAVTEDISKIGSAGRELLSGTMGTMKKSAVLEKIATENIDDALTHSSSMLSRLGEEAGAIGSNRAKAVIDSAVSDIEQMTTKLDDVYGAAKVSKPIDKNAAAEIFMRLDKTKQELQNLVNYTAPNTPERFAIKKLARDLRLHLENEQLWGSAATMQKEVNSAYVAAIGTGKIFRRKFMSKINDLEYAADPDKIVSQLNKASKLKGEPTNELTMHVFDKHIEDQMHLAETVGKHYDLSPELKRAVTELRAAAKSATTTTKAQIQDITMANLIKKIRQEEYGGLGGALRDVGLTGAAFGFLGSPAGVPAALVTAIMKPGTALTAAMQFRRVIRGISEKATAFGYIATKSQATKERILAEIDQAVRFPFREIVPGTGHVLKIASGTSFHEGAKAVVAGATGHIATANRLSAEIKGLSSDPEKMSNFINDRIGALGKYAPSTAAHMSAKLALGISILSQLAPGHDRPASIQPHLDRDLTSQQEAARFNRAVAAFSAPEEAIARAIHGLATPEEMQILHSVYPEMLEVTNAAIAGKLAESDQRLPYVKKLSLSLLSGRPLDMSLQPAFINRQQQTFAQPPAVGHGGGGARISGIEKLTLGQRMASSGEERPL